MNEPAIRVDGLRVVRGGLTVLAGLSCEVLAGSVTGLLGPSGSGKSTLIRAIVGVQQIAAGRVDVLGVTAGSAALRARVGYMTQAPSVYGDLSVQENLAFFARILAVPPKAVEQALADVALAEYRDRVVNRLSGGQRARCRSPSRCSALPTCWCWTSRRSASIRCCAAISGSSSTASPSVA